MSLYEAKISIQGMTCGSCVAAVTNGLESLDGVKSVSISLITERGSIEYDSVKLSSSEIVERVEDCGFDAQLIEDNQENNEQQDKLQKQKLETIKIKIYGMTCSSCSNSVEEGLRSVAGVESAVVALATEEARVTVDTSISGPRDLIDSIEDRGFDAILSSSIDNKAQVESLTRVKEIQRYRRLCITAITFSVPVSIISMLIPDLFPFLAFLKFNIIPGLYFDDVLNCLLTIPVQFGVGKQFYINAYSALKHKSPNMDVLVSLSTSCAFFFSCFTVIMAILKGSSVRPSTLWDTAAMLVTFVTVGKYLENKAKGKTSVALSRLISLVPSTATIYKEDGEKVISSDLIQIGDVVILRPGEKAPADGVVVSGTSYLSESLITGESLPIAKKSGDQVIGGSVNGPGRIDFRVTRAGGDTKLSQIVRLVQDAQTSRAPVQRYADFLSGYFVPTVIFLGLSTFVIWMVISHVVKQNLPSVFQSGEGSFMVCLRLCISVIVVACPCALGLATPTAVMVGTGVGATHGILIKGGATLETANEIQTVLFDKTGTLTIGKMTVTNWKNMATCDSKTWWKLVGVLEAGSEHPVAESIVKRAMKETQQKAAFVDKDGNNKNPVSDFQVHVGEGVKGDIYLDDTTYKVIAGNQNLMDRFNIDYPREEIEKLTVASGDTTIIVAIDGVYAGWIAMSDAVKPEAKAAIENLKKLGLKVGMVTGDNKSVAMKVGKELNIPKNKVWAGVSPSGKIDLVRGLQGEYDDNVNKTKVAMVGDGINDSPALAAAALGITISGASDVAVETADIVLIRKDALLDVASAIDLSRKSFKRIKMNLIWALIYNIIMIPFAMGFFLPFGLTLHPMIAGAAMALSSVSVVLSSLLLQFWQPPKWMNRDSAAGLSVYDDDDEYDRFSAAPIQSGRQPNSNNYNGLLSDLWGKLKQKAPRIFGGSDDGNRHYEALRNNDN